MSAHRIHISRERHKFSCAHMTVFPDGRKERLHGHNYYLSIEVELSSVSFDALVEFAPLKRALAALCDEWREHLLLAADNPHFAIVRDDGVELEFRLCGERYLVPRGDAILLPIDNVSTEALAQLALERVIEGVPELAAPAVAGVRVTVEESPGQGASASTAGRTKGHMRSSS